MKRTKFIANKKVITNKRIIGELRSLYKRNGGILLPGAIVNAARNPKSAMHSHFEWDDSVAAEKFRISQAQQLLRVTVEYMDVEGDKTPVRVFVSLKNDQQGKGGYRAIADVLTDEDLTAQLLSDALEDLQWIKIKYASLKQLAEVFAAIDRIKK